MSLNINNLPPSKRSSAICEIHPTYNRYHHELNYSCRDSEPMDLAKSSLLDEQNLSLYHETVPNQVIPTPNESQLLDISVIMEENVINHPTKTSQSKMPKTVDISVDMSLCSSPDEIRDGVHDLKPINIKESDPNDDINNKKLTSNLPIQSIDMSLVEISILGIKSSDKTDDSSYNIKEGVSNNDIVLDASLFANEPICISGATYTETRAILPLQNSNNDKTEIEDEEKDLVPKLKSILKTRITNEKIIIRNPFDDQIPSSIRKRKDTEYLYSETADTKYSQAKKSVLTPLTLHNSSTTVNMDLSDTELLNEVNMTHLILNETVTCTNLHDSCNLNNDNQLMRDITYTVTVTNTENKLIETANNDALLLRKEMKVDENNLATTFNISLDLSVDTACNTAFLDDNFSSDSSSFEKNEKKIMDLCSQKVVVAKISPCQQVLPPQAITERISWKDIESKYYDAESVNRFIQNFESPSTTLKQYFDEWISSLEIDSDSIEFNAIEIEHKASITDIYQNYPALLREFVEDKCQTYLNQKGVPDHSEVLDELLVQPDSVPTICKQTEKSVETFFNKIKLEFLKSFQSMIEVLQHQNFEKHQKLKDEDTQKLAMAREALKAKKNVKKAESLKHENEFNDRKKILEIRIEEAKMENERIAKNIQMKEDRIVELLTRRLSLHKERAKLYNSLMDNVLDTMTVLDDGISMDEEFDEKDDVENGQLTPNERIKIYKKQFMWEVKNCPCTIDENIEVYFNDKTYLLTISLKSDSSYNINSKNIMQSQIPIKDITWQKIPSDDQLTVLEKFIDKYGKLSFSALNLATRFPDTSFIPSILSGTQVLASKLKHLQKELQFCSSKKCTLYILPQVSNDAINTSTNEKEVDQQSIKFEVGVFIFQPFSRYKIQIELLSNSYLEDKLTFHLKRLYGQDQEEYIRRHLESISPEKGYLEKCLNIFTDIA
ncbi:uncharacterized protein LOC135924089 [Gordionus sp. m RMFG-2023]|uniref:uncharacterized protein LOC135924089 n=1 Tax=Gordionus sp. m RMFG-2023 TaxID=3053472 RepID=UPI0031FD1084